ncbi:MAG TPA: hypothetical protein VHB21_16540 [Minicystis sp.]|nr:hypothetical protein [Minicystis sp.]
MKRRTLLAGLSLLLPFAAGCGDNLTHPPSRSPAEDPDAGVLACVPNLDGRIDANELAAAIGVPVHYTVNPPGEDRTVDVEGKQAPDGTYAWTLSADYADDEALVVTPALAKDQWYAASFPADAFVTPYDAAGRLDSVGRLDDQGLWLLGIASHVEMPAEGQTLLVYDTPIQLLEFPVAPPQSFVSTGQVTNGMAEGLPYAGMDTYEVTVDGTGSLDLPTLTFDQVYRVRTKVTVEPAVGAAVVREQVSFYAECFAEVARATSADGTTSPHFTDAVELRRLGF